MSRNPLHPREDQDEGHEPPRQDDPPNERRVEMLERAAKELGVTYEELRSALEH